MSQKKRHYKNHISMFDDYELRQRQCWTGVSVLDVANAARIRWQEGYFDDDFEFVAASMDAALEVVADGAVEGRDSDVPYIQEEIMYLLVAVVSILSTFQPEGGVIIYEKIDERCF